MRLSLSASHDNSSSRDGSTEIRAGLITFASLLATLFTAGTKSHIQRYEAEWMISQSWEARKPGGLQVSGICRLPPVVSARARRAQPKSNLTAKNMSEN